jgi:hypothetical protein
MKKLIITLAALTVTVAAYGQGAVTFNNRVTGVVDARVMLPDGKGAGAGFTAQLIGGPAGTAVDKLVALTPSTTFRENAAGTAQGYVNAVDVTVPGVAAGSQATLVMRAYNGSDYASSALKGQSAAITIALGGGTLPPANLAGLQGFSISGSAVVIPEPSTIALGVLGAALLLIRRRK